MAKKKQRPGLNFQSQVSEVNNGTWPLLRKLGDNVMALAVNDRDYAVSFLGPDERKLMDLWETMFESDNEEEEDEQSGAVDGLADDINAQEALLDRFVERAKKLA